MGNRTQGYRIPREDEIPEEFEKWAKKYATKGVSPVASYCIELRQKGLSGDLLSERTKGYRTPPVDF